MQIYKIGFFASAASIPYLFVHSLPKTQRKSPKSMYAKEKPMQTFIP